MNLRLQSTGKWVVMFAEGRLDSLNYDLIEFRIKTLLRMGKVFVGIDLSQATFMNIATLSLVVRTAKMLRAKSGLLAIIAANAEIRANLHEFGGRHVGFFESLEDLKGPLAEAALPKDER